VDIKKKKWHTPERVILYINRGDSLLILDIAFLLGVLQFDMDFLCDEIDRWMVTAIE